jgi:hypothetical protein
MTSAGGRTLMILGLGFVVLNVAVVAAEPWLLRLARYDFEPTAAGVVIVQDAPRSDVLFMGSSRALFGLDPAIAEADVAQRAGVEIRAFNVAVAGGATDMNYLILKNIVGDNKRPHVLIYGLAEFELMRVPNYVPCRFPYFALLLRPDDFAVCPGTGVEGVLNFVLNQSVPLARDRDLIRNGVNTWLNPDDWMHRRFAPGPDHETLRDDGFGTWPKSFVIDQRVLAANRAGIRGYLSHFQFDAARVARLHDLLQLARAWGIGVLLVDMPVAPEFQELWDDTESRDRYQATVRAIAEAQGVPLLDLYANPAESSLSTSMFLDLDHLSPAGAAAVTRLVAERYLVPHFAQRSINRNG